MLSKLREWLSGDDAEPTGDPDLSVPLTPVAERGTFGVDVDGPVDWGLDPEDVESVHREADRRYDVADVDTDRKVADLHVEVVDGVGHVVDVEWHSPPVEEE